MNTMFLATVIGWYLVIVSLCMLLRHDTVKAAMKDLIAHRGSFFVVAIITLIIGLLLVATHNIWVMGWPVVITIFAWLVLIGGIIRLFFPDVVTGAWQSMFKQHAMMQIVSVLTLILGLFLLYHVYHIHF